VAKKGHAEEQILRALHQAESGTRVADICREHGISEATFYIWKKKLWDGPRFKCEHLCD
jgi:putative transposase